jgi:hypothetical protein
MSRLLCNRVVPSLVVLSSICCFAFATAEAAPDGERAAAGPTIPTMETYAEPGGETYFALQLAPRIAQPVRAAHDVFVLFDTSASQAGEYRETALAALDGLLAGLHRDDRVLLLAVDLNTVPLTPSLGGAQSEAMRKALGDLRRRVPLGATDLAQALETVLAAYGNAADPARARSVVYIGDGMSTARLLLSNVMRALMDRFVEARISISSYAIGPRLDLPLLAALAKHTGGALLVDDELTGRRAGSSLADAALGTVVWPTDVELPPGCHGVYFRGLPPLRFDRATVLLGTVEEAAVTSPTPLHVAVRADVDGRRTDLAWDVVPAPPSPDHAYLARLVEAARQDGGASLPSLGSDGLAELRWLVNQGAWDLTKLAEQALAMGNLDHADRLAAEAGRLDPNNAELAVLRGAVDKTLRSRRNRRPPKPAPLADAETASSPAEPDGALIDRVELQNRVFEGWLRTEVQNVVNRARAAITNDPESAIEMLKLAQERVAGATELSADVRAQLKGRLESALRNAARQATAQAERAAQLEQVAAESEARERINRDLFIREQKVEQLMARFESLMDEERYRDAEAVADIAEAMAPYRAGMRTAELDARMVGYTSDMRRLRDARHRGLVDALYTVETSHVPTPDEPPIVYPDPEVWQMLTERRKKWKSVDLRRRSESEAKIYAALDEKTELDFTDQPLSDVIDYLKNRHEIEIQLDNKALADAGLGSDTTVTRNVKGVSLRSALRLLLGEFDLTYVVHDEIMLITTKTEAENMLSTRVYPVGDLVIPVRLPTGMPGGMGGMGGRGMF